MNLMKQCGIYRIVVTRGVDKPPKYYIGHATNMRERWLYHLSRLRNNKHKNPELQNAYNRYGLSSFSHEIVLVCQRDRHILQMYEQAILDLQIANYGDRSVYNCHKLCVLSRAGLTNSPEHKMAVSKSQKGRKKSEAEIEAIRIGNIGKKHSPEDIAKQIAAQTGRIIPPEVRAKMSAARTGMKLSPEACANIAASKRGIPMHLNTRLALERYYQVNGRKQTPEAIEKSASSRRGIKKSAADIARRQATRRANAALRGATY